MDIPAIMASGPVIPVIEIESEDDAIPLARALLAGGVKVLEITLRTPAALGAIKRISKSVKEAVVGAGTVLTAEDVRRALDAGAQFAISPGLTIDIAEACADGGLPLLPGAVTATELMLGRKHGFRNFKFFPAASSGGAAAVKAFAGPFADLKFCPTGGINPDNAGSYLSLPNVPCVGGSWLAPKDLVASKDWDAITDLALKTQSLRA
ncbi:MAG: bifunctional 4-hydroxy-2-oxoglutarate aldolase/2-dehydro-3-deoxy-phosphogluconate aldolase [Caulobacterales bacterium]